MLQGSAARYIARLLQADCVPCKPLRLEVHKPFNGKCHDMAKRDMRFLDMHRHVAWNGEKHIGTFRQLAAALTRHGTDPDAVLARRLAGRHHISGIAACRNRDQHVAGPAQCFHLPSEYTFKAKIICICLLYTSPSPRDS